MWESVSSSIFFPIDLDFTGEKIIYLIKTHFFLNGLLLFNSLFKWAITFVDVKADSLGTSVRDRLSEFILMIPLDFSELTT